MSHSVLAVRFRCRSVSASVSARSLLLGFVALLALVAPSVASAAKPPLKLVTIGDSYTAGNGANGPGAGPRGCSRRKGNWGNKFMSHLKATYKVTYVNRACSGAVIADVQSSQPMGKDRAADVYIRKVTIDEADVSKDDAKARRALLDAGRCRSANKDEIYSITATKATQIPPPQSGTVVEFRCVRRMQPQIKAITKDTDLVVLSLGGNDVRFATIIKKCFVPIAKGPGGCRKLVDDAKALLPEVQADLTAALRQVKKRLGADAKIVVNSYPYLEGDEDYKLGIKGTDKRYAAGLGVRNFQDRADAFELAAINDVNNEAGAKVKFLDQVKNRFAGHEPLAALTKVNTDSWLHGLDTKPALDNYHYNPQGHTEVKKLLVDFSPITATRSQIDDGPIDLALVVDTSGSMGGPLAQIKETAPDLLASIAGKSTSSRFALVDYRDFPERTGDPSDYAAALQQDFTTDISAVSGAVDALSIGYGGDNPETMYSGIHTALDLQWRDEARKIVIVLTDADALDPEPISEFSGQSVIDKALGLDRAEISVIRVARGGDTFRSSGSGSSAQSQSSSSAGRSALIDSSVTQDRLTVDTGGQLLADIDQADVPATIEGIVEDSIRGPVADLGELYAARIGEEIVFDADGSYAPEGEIERYDWDFDGDGYDDESTTAPTVSHTFADEFVGTVRLRVTDSDGLTGSTVTPVSATSDGDDTPSDEDNCPLIANPDQFDDDEDGIGDECDDTPNAVEVPEEPDSYGYSGIDPFPFDGPAPTTPAPTTPTPTTPTPTTPTTPTPTTGARIVGVTAVAGRGFEVKLSCERVPLCVGVVQVTHNTTKVWSPYLVLGGRSSSFPLLVARAARDELRAGAQVTVTVRVTPLLGTWSEQTFTVEVRRA